jgi:hypothetical protein
VDKSQESSGRNPAAIVKAAKPLIGWYRANKPMVKRIAVTPDDWRQLESAQARTLQNNSIRKIGDAFYFEDFELYRKA